jgi:hypothetical protein
MPLLPPAHHETSKCDSLNETKIKEKQNKTVPDLNSNLTKLMTHHNQTKEQTTWFLNLSLDESIDNKSTKFKVRIQDPMIVIYHVTSLIHPISKSSTNFMPILSPFGNELIKHEPREEWDAMHENQH